MKKPKHRISLRQRRNQGRIAPAPDRDPGEVFSASRMADLFEGKSDAEIRDEQSAPVPIRAAAAHAADKPEPRSARDLLAGFMRRLRG